MAEWLCSIQLPEYLLTAVDKDEARKLVWQEFKDNHLDLYPFKPVLDDYLVIDKMSKEINDES